MLGCRVRATLWWITLAGGVGVAGLVANCGPADMGNGDQMDDSDDMSDGGNQDGDGGDDGTDGGSDDEQVLTLQTPDGAVTIHSDDRDRPVKVIGPDLTAELDWSDDGGTVTARITAEGVDSESTVSMDLSDEALLESADGLEADTGEDLSDFRQFIADNPGLVARVAAGDLSSLPAAKSLNRMQNQGSVTRHLVDLRLNFANLMRFANEWRREQELTPGGVQEPFRSIIYVNLIQTASHLWLDYVQQVQACTACDASCRANCAGDVTMGACCGEDLICQNTVETQCNGHFRSGLTCAEVDCSVGCCCIDIDGPVTPTANFDQPPQESPNSADGCAQIQVNLANSNLIGTTTFFPGQECDATPCNE